MVCETVPYESDKYLYYCIGTTGVFTDPDVIMKYDGVNPPSAIAWQPPNMPGDDGEAEKVVGLYYSPTILKKLIIMTGGWKDILVPGDYVTASRLYLLDPSDDSVTLWADWFDIADDIGGAYYANTWVTSAIEWKGQILVGSSGMGYYSAIGIVDLLSGVVTRVWYNGVSNECQSDYDTINGFGTTEDYVYFTGIWIVRSLDGVSWSVFYQLEQHAYDPPCPLDVDHGIDDCMFPVGISQYDSNTFYFAAWMDQIPVLQGAKSVWMIQNDVISRVLLDDIDTLIRAGGSCVTSKDSYGDPSKLSFISFGGASASGPQCETIRVWDSLDGGLNWIRYVTDIDPDGATAIPQSYSVKFFKNQIYVLAKKFSSIAPRNSARLFRRTGDITFELIDDYPNYNVNAREFGDWLGNGKMAVVTETILIQGTPVCSLPPCPNYLQLKAKGL